jgi:hypothetical protein
MREELRHDRTCGPSCPNGMQVGERYISTALASPAARQQHGTSAMPKYVGYLQCSAKPTVASITQGLQVPVHFLQKRNRPHAFKNATSRKVPSYLTENARFLYARCGEHRTWRRTTLLHVRGMSIFFSFLSSGLYGAVKAVDPPATDCCGLLQGWASAEQHDVSFRGPLANPMFCARLEGCAAHGPTQPGELMMTVAWSSVLGLSHLLQYIASKSTRCTTMDSKFTVKRFTYLKHLSAVGCRRLTAPFDIAASFEALTDVIRLTAS